ncbi:uncharacterized protein LOC126908281 [Daktulosphaira vitifoliae]|uniref:uncharacterized protein LOC126908281 n=1 Tax=Daktulosphaira vitifoliae TaxID=58002 RepID=UPI0021AAAAD6|nr:uncharacterized protein LOC126908281 [Daktulosphaira vitifoliae]
MCTRAIHLELTSTLATEDFLAVFNRFIARRGQCSDLFSDNGTGFVGANRILQNQFLALQKCKKLSDFLLNLNITWHFIPPSAPHFGGLWEAAVQSAKRHLLKVTKGVMLKYDETVTLLCEIEAVLNSRPLCPNSTDPSDFNVLTPAHFLVGGSLLLPAEPDVSSVP